MSVYNENNILFELIEELSKKLPIDRFDLDTMCAEQPELYYQAASLFAQAEGIKFRAEAFVQESKSSIANEIRNQREKDGVKTTENMIMELVDSDNEMVSIRKARAEAYELFAHASALLNAFEHRRSMINNEVQLLVNNVSRAVGKNSVKKMEEHYESKSESTESTGRRRRRSKK